jgi:hypothetical protein
MITAAAATAIVYRFVPVRVELAKACSIPQLSDTILVPSVPNLGAAMRKAIRRVLRVTAMSGAKDW